MESLGSFHEFHCPTGVVNDIFFHITTPEDFWQRDSNGGGQYEARIRPNSRLLQAICSSGTGWRDMYVTQPPTNRFEFFWSTDHGERFGRPVPAERTVRDWPDLRSPHGITVGEVADMMLLLQEETRGKLSMARSDEIDFSVLDFFWISQKAERQLREQVDLSDDDGADFIGQEGCEYRDRNVNPSYESSVSE